MARRRFVFSLEPKLGFAQTARDEAAGRLAAAARATVAARAAHAEARENLRVHLQRIRAERDYLRTPAAVSVDELQQRERHIDALAAQTPRYKRAVEERRSREALAERFEAIKREDLARTERELEALRRLRDRQHEAFLREQAAAEDAKTDEAGADQWFRARRAEQRQEDRREDQQ